MDNASHSTSIEQRQVGLRLTSILKLLGFFWGGGDEEEDGKWDQNSTEQLCLGKETINQKC